MNTTGHAAPHDLPTPAQIRLRIVEMTHRSGSSHVGSCLSLVDILWVLYFKVLQIDPADPHNPLRDRCLLSKAHGSAALYATLAARGYFADQRLDGFYINDGTLPGHLDRKAAPGVEMSGGSLGHGLPLGVGMALANRLDGVTARVVVVMGDGECNEGSVWEAAMLAGHHRLDKLTVIIDYNHWQSFGRPAEVLDPEPFADRWRAFGWQAIEVDGHAVDALEAALLAGHDRPMAIIAHTIKGKGVSFMEDRLEWHYKSPNAEQLAAARTELLDRST